MENQRVAYEQWFVKRRGPKRPAEEAAAQEAAARTRHLNIWVGADEALFSLRSWHEAADPMLSIDDFEGQECYLGLDLASRTDLAAMALAFPVRDAETGRTTYVVFGAPTATNNVIRYNLPRTYGLSLRYTW